jgi:3-oxoacyl-[acyl-carrier protein] reductase
VSHLTDKVVLVTGGSRGIGAAIVERMAREHADVAFTYRKAKDRADAMAAKVKEAGRRSLAIRADSANPGELTAAVQRTASELGRIDVLVSSAGMLLFKPIDQFTLEDFDSIIATDLRAAFVASKAALEHLPRGGRIIIVGSNIAHYAALPTTSFYSMVKSGLVGLAKGMARDLGPRGITVNVVQPGPIDTEANPSNGQYGDQLRAFMATPQYGSGRDVAGLVAYLASEESQFATGGVFTIDNGFTA